MRKYVKWKTELKIMSVKYRNLKKEKKESSEVRNVKSYISGTIIEGTGVQGVGHVIG